MLYSPLTNERTNRKIKIACSNLVKCEINYSGAVDSGGDDIYYHHDDRGVEKSSLNHQSCRLLLVNCTNFNKSSLFTLTFFLT